MGGNIARVQFFDGKNALGKDQTVSYGLTVSTLVHWKTHP
jgi:hypothetical protein